MRPRPRRSVARRWPLRRLRRPCPATTQSTFGIMVNPVPVANRAMPRPTVLGSDQRRTAAAVHSPATAAPNAADRSSPWGCGRSSPTRPPSARPWPCGGTGDSPEHRIGEYEAEFGAQLGRDSPPRSGGVRPWAFLGRRSRSPGGLREQAGTQRGLCGVDGPAAWAVVPVGAGPGGHRSGRPPRGPADRHRPAGRRGLPAGPALGPGAAEGRGHLGTP